MNEGQPGLSDNLQAFVSAGIISDNAAHLLPDPQKTAIQNLSQSEIDTIISVHEKVGAILSPCFI